MDWTTRISGILVLVDGLRKKHETLKLDISVTLKAIFATDTATAKKYSFFFYLLATKEVTTFGIVIFILSDLKKELAKHMNIVFECGHSLAYDKYFYKPSHQAEQYVST